MYTEFLFVLICLYTKSIFLNSGGKQKCVPHMPCCSLFLGDRNSDYWLLTIPLLSEEHTTFYSFWFAAIMLEEIVKICEPQLTPTPTPTRCFNVWINSQHLSVTANTKQKGQILAQKFGAGARGALWWGGGPRDRCSRGTGIGVGVGLGRGLWQTASDWSL